MTLYDEIHAWTYGDAARHLKLTKHGLREYEHNMLGLRMALRQAKRFVLDKAFVRAAVYRSRVPQPKMLNLLMLANLPFEKIWIEYDNNARLDMQVEMGIGAGRLDDDHGPAGFLIERRNPDNPGAYNISHSGYVTRTAGGTPVHPPVLDPFSPLAPTGMVVDVSGMLPYLAPRENDRLRHTETKLRGLGWGYTQPTDEMVEGVPGLIINTGEELTRRGGICLEWRFFDVLSRSMVELDDDACDHLGRHFAMDAYEARGNLRLVTAILAMINTCPIEYKHRAAHGHYRARLRNVPYLDSHTITIRAGNKKVAWVVDQAIRTALGRHNRRHPVRGHWALAEYGHGGRACAHEPVERDGHYAICGKCEKLLIWRDHYERGDASLGYVQHDYEVRI